MYIEVFAFWMEFRFNRQTGGWTVQDTIGGCGLAFLYPWSPHFSPPPGVPRSGTCGLSGRCHSGDAESRLQSCSTDVGGTLLRHVRDKFFPTACVSRLVSPS